MIFMLRAELGMLLLQIALFVMPKDLRGILGIGIGLSGELAKQIVREGKDQ